MGFQISLCKLHKNSLSDRFLEGKTVTLWDELTEHKVVSQKASLRFLSEETSFFTVALYGHSNVTLQIRQEPSSREASWGESCNSVRWINRTQSSFSESFFPVLTEDISFLPYPSMGLQISLSKFHKNSLSERILEGKAVTLWDVLTEHIAVSQTASFHFLTEDIPFFTIALYGLPNITLQIPEEQS